MEERVYERINRLLSQEEFSWVIMDSFTHKELASFMERMGITYPGTRTISLPYAKLAWDLSEDAKRDVELTNALVRKINDLNSLEISETHSLDGKGIDDYLKGNIERFYFENRLGKVIWALLIDERKAVNEKLPEFIKDIDRISKLIEEEKLQGTPQRSPQRIFEQLEAKWVKKTVEKLVRRNKFVEDANRFLNKENKKLVQKIDSFHKRIKELERTLTEVNQEKGILHKEIYKKDEQIKQLDEKIIKLKEEPKLQPVKILRSSLHHLERENKKLMYELEREKNQSARNQQEFENQKHLLKMEIEGIQERERGYLQSLEEAKKRIMDLESKLEEDRGGRERNFYPHKGKRVGIFIDVQNLSYLARHYFNKRVDYNKLLPFLLGNRHLVKAMCYILKPPEVNQDGFINMLKKNGYTVRTRDLVSHLDGYSKRDWDIGMAMDVQQMVEKNSLDIIILVSCDADFVDLIKVIKPKGIRIEVSGFSASVSLDLKNISDEFIEIGEELMLKT